ncbi:MAG: hypothetical protein IJ806_02230 [Ruminococcus sp.]|nr:hypothetical protein [Ruminococcus sp.]
MMKVITVNQACRILAEHGHKVTPTHLGAGLQQGVYPFGVAIKMTHWVYEIYDVLLMKWIAEREEP